MMQLLGVPDHRLLQNHLPTPRHRRRLATSWMPHVLRHRALRVHCKRCQHAPDPGASWGHNSRKLRAGAELNRKITRTRTRGPDSQLSSFLTEIRPVGTV